MDEEWPGWRWKELEELLAEERITTRLGQKVWGGGWTNNCAN